MNIYFLLNIVLFIIHFFVNRTSSERKLIKFLVTTCIYVRTYIRIGCMWWIGMGRRMLDWGSGGWMIAACGWRAGHRTYHGIVNQFK